MIVQQFRGVCIGDIPDGLLVVSGVLLQEGHVLVRQALLNAARTHLSFSLSLSCSLNISA